ncbi:MAG TPA: cell division protein ZapA [Candidatus Hydrogenedens sp.]|nr:cell division protein ZapA [Candidatus Hydrogenedens sp.]HOK08639.1 cell division protein ZapA [Candidatus Hydrogenedens sp.]HOL20947.1 cell division protein ZapA [Candidatus Hydrogenedens sp.]HPP58320.1 cell division protein ZapA [Candidatus Hydrogenedens sp.]
MKEDLIKVKIYNNDVEIPVYKNIEKTNELIKTIENRMEELKTYYKLTRTQMFALRIAYEYLVELEKQKEKIKSYEKQIENIMNEMTDKTSEIIDKIKERMGKDQD